APHGPTPGTEATAPIPRLPRATASYPLSFSQRRMWFLHEFYPVNPIYNLAYRIGLRGVLDTSALRRSLAAIVQRHEILRTTFGSTDGEPFQVIHPEVDLDLSVVDLRAHPPEEGSRRATELAASEARTPFELRTGPLLRVTHLRLADDEHVLLITFDHVVSDEWSLGVFVRELGVRYSALATDAAPALPELPIGYVDFAGWQLERLQGSRLERLIAYWHDRLAGMPTAVALPTDRPRPPSPTFEGTTLTFTLPPQLSRALRAFGYDHGATLFMTLLSGFIALLARSTGQDDIAVAFPFAGRPRAETRDLIGLFVNTLVCRTDVADDPSFAELIARVRRTAVEAYANSELPFEKLVEVLHPDRRTFMPLVNVMFAVQDRPLERLHLTGLSLDAAETHNGTSKFDLSMTMIDDGERLAGVVEYRTELFDAARIERMVGHYGRLLEAAVADPAAGLSRLPMVSPSERRQLLAEWNDTARELPRDLVIHEAFERQAKRTPDEVALYWRDQAVTYRDLNRRANRLARHLMRHGMGPEAVVGICLERSVDMVVAMLAVLKARGAYLPLDPTSPNERMAFMLEDAQAGILVTEAALLARVPVTGARMVCVDAERAAIDRESSRNLPRRTRAEQLAYVLFTSGSTGRPKGVAIEHRNTMAFLAWAGEVFPAEERAGVLATTSICFDLSVFELFLPLCLGGAVILVDNVLDVASVDATRRPSLLNTIPSGAAELLRSNGLPASVR
ncbi:MAG: non-ribosomal peptide synthetase, partial [Gammaproteobacteria bacterium]